ncbi:potassium-transporting ATPase subunit KdpA [Cupriavidus basilensis]
MPLLLIQLGEVVFGGVGSGPYGMLVYAVLAAVFIAGLMIGRTPGIPGQADRSVRNEDGRGCHPSSRRCWCWSVRRSR